MQANAGRRRQTQAYAGSRKQTQADAGRRGHTQAHAGTRRHAGPGTSLHGTARQHTHARQRK
eukprot:2932059-Karenia_brevis.AAC.1